MDTVFPMAGRRRRNRWWRYGKWAAWALVVFLILDGAYLYSIWPDWTALGRGSVPRSVFMERYAEGLRDDPQRPPLRWQPVPFNHIPRHLRHAAVAAEDARFFEHGGIDLLALRDAMRYNLDHLDLKYGGSTISQQTVKNLFLSPSRNPLRKWHELVLTLGMELNISKQRILELYLNIAEFGEGIYGVEAAAQYYWQRPASALTEWQAAQLAATLPSPRRHNPATATRQFLRRARRIYRFMRVQVYDHPAG